ncbi:MAG TPA: hypothetical protein VK084_04620 [Chitinophagaceae bacterium]|nr:hypothetical protein [Chitinophagaceae bacterium]
MEVMSIGKLKTHFSEVLKRVVAGEEIAISYGKKKEIVAKLVPKVSKEIQKREIGLLDGQGSIHFKKGFKMTEEEFIKG